MQTLWEVVDDIVKEEDLEDGSPYAEAGAPFSFSKEEDGYPQATPFGMLVLDNTPLLKDVYVVGIMGIVSIKFQNI
jgi:hypothetical protein